MDAEQPPERSRGPLRPALRSAFRFAAVSVAVDLVRFALAGAGVTPWPRHYGASFSLYVALTAGRLVPRRPTDHRLLPVEEILL